MNRQSTDYLITVGFQAKGAKEVASQMNDFHKALARVAIVVPIWMAARAVFQSFFKLIAEQIKFIVDLEDAMARIKIIGKGTAEEYNNLKFALVGLSLAYGISASEALKAAVIFAQQGYTVSETLTLTRAAMIGAQVLGEDIKETVEALTATMKAFSIPIQNVTLVIDRLIAVEKEFAVTSKDLATGIKVVGATANMIGVSMAALVGDITAVVEVTRKSGAEAARGLQFIYARLLTTGKPVIEQLTGIKFYLDEQRKATNALTGKLRNATDILDELAGKWRNLTNEQQLNIATALGSKRQLVVLSALMLNYAHSIDARITALTSAGEAEKALAILQDTVTYKTKQLTSAWNALTSVLADTSPWKASVDAIAYALIYYTKLINIEKGYKIELAAESGEILANIETRQSQIDSIEELIKIRNKLLAEPPSDKTTERLEKVNRAIESIIEEHPTIKVALETGSPEELRKVIQNISDKLLIKKISVQVAVDFIPEIKTLERKKKEIEVLLARRTPTRLYEEVTGITVKRRKEITEIDKKIADLRKKQTDEEKKQLGLAKAQNLPQEIADEEEVLDLSIDLTDKEKEQLNIERQLIQFRLSENATLDQQIQKEIELVKNSQNVYNAHEKLLKIQQLENQLIDVNLKKREEERSTLASLSMQYEKADMFEKARLRRTAELAVMSPKEVLLTYQTSIFDKNLILDFWSSFPEETRRAIEESTPLMKEFFSNFPEMATEALKITTPEVGAIKGIPTQIAEAPTPQQVNITNIGAQNVEVNVNVPSQDPDEIASLVGNKVKDSLLTDEEFQSTFAKKLGKKI